MLKENPITIAQLIENIKSEITTITLEDSKTPCTAKVPYRNKIFTVLIKENADIKRQAAKSIAEQILELEDQYKRMSMMPIEAHDICTDTMKVTRVFIGLNPKSPMYGKIIGFFTYKNVNYRFHFHVHKPHQKSPHLSNKMENIEKVVSKECYGEIFDEYTDTDLNFGMAFWDNTSLDYIKEQGEYDAYEFRKLIMNVIKFSRNYDLCKEFRKLDRQALKINPIYSK